MTPVSRKIVPSGVARDPTAAAARSSGCPQVGQRASWAASKGCNRLYSVAPTTSMSSQERATLRVGDQNGNLELSIYNALVIAHSVCASTLNQAMDQIYCDRLHPGGSGLRTREASSLGRGYPLRLKRGLPDDPGRALPAAGDHLRGGRSRGAGRSGLSGDRSGRRHRTPGPSAQTAATPGGARRSYGS